MVTSSVIIVFFIFLICVNLSLDHRSGHENTSKILVNAPASNSDEVLFAVECVTLERS